MEVRPTVPGIERIFASTPTLDTERKAPFFSGRPWNPSHIEIFGHSIIIDIPTGNIIIDTTEIAYKYYNMSLGINRKYDAQEQWMQLSYLRNYPNVNPKPHWFGNWQFAYEADVDEVWHNSYPELHVTSGIGANGLFERRDPDFKRRLNDASKIESLLKTYGIPGKTLAELNWKFTKKDFLLRTLRGQFQILSGHFYEETLVDDINAEMWLFNSINGSGFHITSDFFYNIQDGYYRDIGHPMVVDKAVDALGHIIELKPAEMASPFKKYVLSDGSGREFYIELFEELTFPDGMNPERKVRKYLVSKVIDRTKTEHNIFEYEYNNEHLLRKVVFPSAIGNRFVCYHYEDRTHPGILTAIENNQGHKIRFFYIEDGSDNDERLNPRLKIKKIVDPEGVTFEYTYSHSRSEVLVTISENGRIDRCAKYKYIQDVNNTKQRYIVESEIKVARGYFEDSTGNIVPRGNANPQIIRRLTEYTKDGRFNIKKEKDPINRSITYQYNDFNQVEKVWDFDSHCTTYVYDIPNDPSPTNPMCYDILSVEQKNIIRAIDQADLTNIIERDITIKKEFTYDKYDCDNSSDTYDHYKQSTHRISEEIDERRKVWTYVYDDKDNSNPLSPTLIKSPLGIKAESTYNNRGDVLTTTDSASNVHCYEYYEQGTLKEYIDPNQEKIKLIYYPCGNWLHSFIDQLGKTTEFEREIDGRIRRIIDPVQDVVDYEYQKNGRLHKIINHRPSIPSDLANSSSLIAGFSNLETEFRYTPLGKINYLKNAKALELLFEYDEAERMFQWYHNIFNPKLTKFIYDEAGQLRKIMDSKCKITTFTYFNSGLVESVRYPDWNDGINDIPGKLIKYKKYDYFGRVFSILDSEILGSKEFIYDETGNVILRRDPDGFELGFVYDEDNRLVSVKDSNNIFELTITLDELGRPLSLQDSTALDGSLLWRYKYEKQLDSVTKVLGLFEKSVTQIGLVSKFDYNEKGLLKLVEHKWRGPPPKSIYSQHYRFRDDDLIEEVTGDDANSFQYCGTKELIFEATGNLSSDYDEAGNRIYRIDKNVNPTPSNNVYNDINQLEKEFDLPGDFTYDQNGNLQTSTYPVNPTEFYFDGVNRLRLLKNNQYEISYLYDCEGKLKERQAKIISTGSIEKTHFSYLFSKPILINRDNNPLMLLTWDTNGKLLRIRKFQIVGSRDYPNSLFPLYSGFGDIVRFVDSKQNLLVEVSYDAWGNFLKLNDSNNHLDFLGFRNGILDKLFGIILFGSRWYFPKIGRWISDDRVLMNELEEQTSDNKFSEMDTNPIERIRELNNLYSYAHNDPINFVDPSGLSGFVLFGRPFLFLRPGLRVPRAPTRLPAAARRIPIHEKMHGMRHLPESAKSKPQQWTQGGNPPGSQIIEQMKPAKPFWHYLMRLLSEWPRGPTAPSLTATPKSELESKGEPSGEFYWPETPGYTDSFGNFIPLVL